MMDLALMLVTLVFAGEGTTALTAVIAAPEELGLVVNVILVALKVTEPLERRISTARVETEVLVVAHLPGRRKVCVLMRMPRPSLCLDRLLFGLGNSYLHLKEPLYGRQGFCRLIFHSL